MTPSAAHVASITLQGWSVHTTSIWENPAEYILPYYFSPPPCLEQGDLAIWRFELKCGVDSQNHQYGSRSLISSQCIRLLQAKWANDFTNEAQRNTES